MKVRAYWYAAPTVVEVDIPFDLDPGELDDFVRDNLPFPEVDLEAWDEVKG